MESNEIREQLLEAEKAAAAPYLVYPKDSWWQIFLLSLVGPLFVSMLEFGMTSGSPLTFLPTIAISCIVIFVISSQRKRRGAMPAGGKAPEELRVVYRWYFIGAVIVGLIMFAMAIFLEWWISIPVAFILGLGGIIWFGLAYEKAAERARARLA